MARIRTARARGSRTVLAVLLAVLVTMAVPPAPARAADTTRPYLSYIRVNAVADRVTLQWWTDEPTTGDARYWTTSRAAYTTWIRRPGLTLSHSRVINGLRPGTTYHVQLRSTDAAGNIGVSADRTFTTTSSSTFSPGNDDSNQVATPGEMASEEIDSPDRVVGDGTAASCTSAAVVAAVNAGGVITFSCGPEPVTITLTQTLKVRNSTRRLVLDGGGTVTLSGAGVRRILYVDTCDTTLGAVAGNCRYAPDGPHVSVQNLTLADGNATGASYVSPGDTGQGSNGGGGAIFQLGGHLKVYGSVFVRNRCATTGPDLGGGAIRVLAQHSRTPDDLDSSSAARDQDAVTITQSTFGGTSGQGNSCSNGGAISGLRTPVTVVNSLLTDNSAVGCCANPPHPGTPGGGSGGAIYTDGTRYDLIINGSKMQRNSAKAGGSAIFYASDDRTAVLRTEYTISKNNVYAPSGYSPSDQHFENYPGIYYRGQGSPDFIESTIQ